jgi:hypothetical protein
MSATILRPLFCKDESVRVALLVCVTPYGSRLCTYKNRRGGACYLIVASLLCLASSNLHYIGAN